MMQAGARNRKAASRCWRALADIRLRRFALAAGMPRVWDMPCSPGRKGGPLATRAAFALLLVDALAGFFELRQYLVQFGRVGYELLHALHAFVGHFLRHVAVVELRNAALRLRQDLEADPGNGIVRLR